MKEKPVTPEHSEPENQPKQSSPQSGRRKNLIFFILLFLFLAFCIFAVVMRLRDPNITLWKMLNIRNFSVLPKKEVIKPRPPKLLSDQKVTQKIPATGGSAKLTTPTGYTYTVTIGPGVLSGESTITLTPLEEPPFTWPSDPNPSAGSEPPDDPGIDITVDPRLPPPPPPDEPPIDPDNPMDNPPQPPPIDVEVTFIPSEPEPGTVVPDSQDPNEMARRIMESAGLGNLTALISVSPSVTPKPATATRNRGGSGKTPTFFVFVPRQGSPRIIPLGPPIGGSPPDTAPPDEGKPPTGGNGDVPGEGTVTPEDPKDTGKADDATGQAGANGHCTDEYIFAYSQAYSNAQDDGDTAGMNRYGGALKDCAKEKLSYLKRLCETDRRLLRRLDFEQYKQSLPGVPDSDSLMTEAIKLETECKGYYKISGSASPEGFSGGVAITSTIDSHVCGYFDDMWEGTNTYNLSIDAGAGVHDYEGKHTFRLPSRGGSFFAIDTPVGQGLSIIGRSVPVMLPNLGFYGTFDGIFGIDMMLYPMANLKKEITLISTECAETPIDMPAVPLAPEPPLEIPLVPLVPQTNTK